MSRSDLSPVDTSNGRSARRGFTLIELLIVVVIVGILATIAIPKFTNTKGKAFAVTLKADLRNLSVAEESYFYNNAVYTSTVARSITTRRQAWSSTLRPHRPSDGPRARHTPMRIR